MKVFHECMMRGRWVGLGVAIYNDAVVTNLFIGASRLMVEYRDGLEAGT